MSQTTDDQLARATVQMVIKRDGLQQAMILGTMLRPARQEQLSYREMANLFIASCLRNGTSLEALHCGNSNAPGDARFTVAELQTLHLEATIILAAIITQADLAVNKLAAFATNWPR